MAVVWLRKYARILKVWEPHKRCEQKKVEGQNPDNQKFENENNLHDIAKSFEY